MAEAASRPSNRRTITVSVVASVVAICVVILPVFATLLKPWAVNVMSEAMAGEIQEQVQHQAAPVNSAMKVLLEGQIAAIEDEIAGLEFRRDRDRATWSEADDRALRAKQRRLESHRDALAAMYQAEKKPR